MSDEHPEGKIDDLRYAEMEARIAKLEHLVRKLMAAREDGTSPGSQARAAPPRDPTASSVPRSDTEPPPRTPRPEARAAGAGASRPAGAWTPPPRPKPGEPFTLDTEKWLGRAGIGFVVLAFAFLLKLSFDRGWITPALRLVAGGASGVVLLGLGLRLEASRRTLAQALLAGGIGLFYLVTWAGAEIYGYFPLWLSLTLMSTTTLLAFVLAERQESEALGVMAVGGGMVTPWLLQVGAVSEAGLAAYLTVVLVGGAALYVLRGWPELLAVLLLGGWVSVGAHVLQLVVAGPVTLLLLGTYWAATVAVPLVRPLMRASVGSPARMRVLRSTALVGSTATLLLLAAALDLGRVGAGGLALGLAALFGVLAILVRRIPESYTPAVEAVAVSVAVGLVLLSWNGYTPLLLVLETVVLFGLRDRGAPATLTSIGHGLAATAALAFLLQSDAIQPRGMLGFHPGAFPRLAALAVAGFAATRAGRWRLVYAVGAYAGLLLWSLVEFAPRGNGQALVSIAWALQGTAALVVSRVLRNHPAQLTGLATLGLVAAKLLLVDLAQLDPVWRILLFLGFGATLLGLGYWLNAPDAEASGGDGPAP